MPSIGSRLTNAFPSLILRSPAHRLLSDRYMILEFTGRRTGRTYRTPVAYVRDGDRVLMSTNWRWWRNLVGGAPVRLRLRGNVVKGRATPINDPRAAAAVVRRLVDAINSYAGKAGMAHTRGQVDDEEIARAIRDGRVAIEITLDVDPAEEGDSDHGSAREEWE